MHDFHQGIQPTDPAQAANKARVFQAVQGLARQVAAKEAFTESVEEAFNPFAADRAIQFRALRDRRRTREEIRRERIPEAKRVLAPREADEAADHFSEQNQEMDANVLRELRRRLIDAPPGSAEALLEVVLEVFEDPSLADEALDYLLETTSEELNVTVLGAKDLLFKRVGRLVRAGRNIGGESREYSAKGLGAPQELRNLYRDITGNPRDHNQLFTELSQKYPFEKLRDVIEFLLSSLGADLRSKGPSISRGELYRLTTEARVLQSILGVYLFFQLRMQLIQKLFKKKNLSFPKDLGFEALAKEFIVLVDEKYLTASKIFRSGHQLHVDNETLSQIIVFEQFRDAVREVAPRIYRTLQHRYDLLTALIEALEILESKLEDEEEAKKE